ncbi:ABC transporter substrate-binding protein [Lacticaseibacillus sp. GG6-2]
MKKIACFMLTVGMMLLILAGCGQSKSNKKTITIGISAYPGWYTWYAVQGFKEFEKAGVNVKLVWFNTYSDSLTAYDSGKLDGVAAALCDTIPSREKGIASKIVLINDNSAGADGIVANKKYHSLKDLRGAKVVTETGTIEHFFLLTALQRAGLSQKDVKFTNMTMDNAGTAMIANRADAAGLWQPSLGYALSNKKNHLLYSSANIKGLIPDVLMMHANVVKHQHKAVSKIVTAYFKGMNDYAQHPKQGIAYMAKGADLSTADMATAMKGSHLFSVNDNYAALHSTKQDYTNINYTLLQTAQFLNRYGMIKHQLTTAAPSFDTEFVDKLQQEDHHWRVLNTKTGQTHE